MLSCVVKIGEASKVSGVSVRSLRFYEDEGLILPGRCSNGYRDYCRSTLDKVRLVRSLLEVGLPVRLIKEIVPHVSEGSSVSHEQLCAEFLAQVHGYRDRLADRIAALDTQRCALDVFLGEAAG